MDHRTKRPAPAKHHGLPSLEDDTQAGRETVIPEVPSDTVLTLTVLPPDSACWGYGNHIVLHFHGDGLAGLPAL